VEDPTITGRMADVECQREDEGPLQPNHGNIEGTTCILQVASTLKFGILFTLEH
jgi:hypothetical protein